MLLKGLMEFSALPIGQKLYIFGGFNRIPTKNAAFDASGKLKNYQDFDLSLSKVRQNFNYRLNSFTYRIFIIFVNSKKSCGFTSSTYLQKKEEFDLELKIILLKIL